MQKAAPLISLLGDGDPTLMNDVERHINVPITG
jgi:hypothetical protein